MTATVDETRDDERRRAELAALQRRAPGAQFRPPGPRGGTKPGPRRPVLSRLVLLGLRIMGALPPRLAQALGAGAGRLLFRLRGRPRRVTDINLRIAFPDWDDARRDALARASLVQTGRGFAELGALWTWDRDRLVARVRSVEGEEELCRAMDAKGGAIVAILHLGCWEVFGPWITARWPMTGLYRAPRMRELSEYLQRVRERHGARLLPAGSSAARELLTVLKRGEVVCLLPDQDAGEGAGIFVPFFGELANTTVLLPRLAQSTRAPVFLAVAERLPRGAGWNLSFTRAPEGVYDENLERSARALNAGLEQCIERLPEQYLWSYKRWRIRPPGSPDPYRREDGVR